MQPTTTNRSGPPVPRAGVRSIGKRVSCEPANSQSHTHTLTPSPPTIRNLTHNPPTHLNPTLLPSYPLPPCPHAQYPCAALSFRRYELEFKTLLPEIAADLAAGRVDGDGDTAEGGDSQFSFITGQYRAVHQPNTANTPLAPTGEIALRNNVGMVAELPAARFLASRSFSGLERKLGETPVVKAVEGRSGIAASYETIDEPQ